MLSGMLAVEFERVSKNFGASAALKDVSFELPEGTTVGLLGPNGSGKTTSIRLMLNLFYPDSGRIRIFGRAPSRAVSDRIGYLPEERGLYRKMRVEEHLLYYARLKGVRPSEQQLGEWLQTLDVERYRKELISSLSKGTAQKVQFISTVLHDPDLVILDEPFSGLDPLSREHLRAAIERLTRQRKTILLSTHDMAAAEQMCDSFLMVYRGTKVLDGTRSEIRRSHGGQTIKLCREPPLSVQGVPVGVERILDYKDHQELVLHEGANDQAILAEVSRAGRVTQFELAEPSLTDIFLRLARD
jgi:ABC-2 type transport system ATP-binding protein